ncbi:actin nucleation factor [Homalodisca vitripennis]|nr:actin nucleation factor [Homalodisca vitripennis]
MMETVLAIIWNITIFKVQVDNVKNHIVFSRARFSRSKTLGRPEEKAEKLKGLEMIVCHDCKTMVIQIIKSSRTSRSNAIRNLTLDLSPVY